MKQINSMSEDGMTVEPTAHRLYRRDDPDDNETGGGTSSAGMLLSPGAAHTGAASGFAAVGTAHASTVTVNSRSRGEQGTENGTAGLWKLLSCAEQAEGS